MNARDSLFSLARKRHKRRQERHDPCPHCGCRRREKVLDPDTSWAAGLIRVCADCRSDA